MASVVVQLGAKSDDLLFKLMYVTKERGNISTEKMIGF